MTDDRSDVLEDYIPWDDRCVEFSRDKFDEVLRAEFMRGFNCKESANLNRARTAITMRGEPMYLLDNKGDLVLDSFGFPYRIREWEGNAPDWRL